MSAAVLPVAPVVTPAGGLRQELRAVRVVWQRDIQRFLLDKPRIVGSLVQPLLFIFVLGKGLASTVGGGSGDDYSTFLFPGMVVTGVMFSAVFSAISIVWDREVGFLREMLVAPISRTGIVVGKCLGGATVASIQGVVLLALAGLVGVPYDPVMLVGCLGVVFAAAFTITAAALVLAVRVNNVQTVMPLVQLLLAPLMFLSGSLFPAGGDLPAWLRAVTYANPVSYAVDAMQTVVFAHAGDVGREALTRGVTWGDWAVPGWLDVVLVLTPGLLLLGVASALFARSE